MDTAWSIEPIGSAWALAYMGALLRLFEFEWEAYSERDRLERVCPSHLSSALEMYMVAVARKEIGL